MKYTLILSLTLTSCVMSAQNDFNIAGYANFQKYASANAALDLPEAGEQRVVFMGNSITEFWVPNSPEFFIKNNYIGRGISGQVTDQMLLRFRADVIDLKPAAVVILAGTNDIAQNSGPVSLEHIANNIKSMAELARQHNIKVILCSVLPAKDYPWRPGLDPLHKIPQLNAMIKAYAEKSDIAYVDYYAAMQDGNGGMKVPEHTTANDLVHPNKAGYTVMESVVKPVIDRVLNKN